MFIEDIAYQFGLWKIENLLSKHVIRREPCTLAMFNLGPIEWDFNQTFAETNPVIRKEIANAEGLDKTTIVVEVAKFNRD